MRKSRVPFQWLSALLALLLQSSILASEAVGVEADWEYSYDPCSPLGPQNWGNLHEEWAKCGNGEQQTPISIKPSNIVNKLLGPLVKHYAKRRAFLQNKGHEIMVNWEVSPGHLTIDGKIFHLRQCHWHSPSEHELYGKRYPLELHIVHSTEDTGEIAVIGVLYELSNFPDPFLNKLREHLIELLNQSSVDVGDIHPPVMGNVNYFRYNGSLTTPPCSEPVVWTLMKEVKSVTEDQLSLLRAPVNFKDNARPIQPTNGRQVYFDGWPHEDHASS